MQKKSFYRISCLCQKSENEFLLMVFCGCSIPPKLHRCMVCHGPKHSANLTLKSMSAVPKKENPLLPCNPVCGHQSKEKAQLSRWFIRCVTSSLARLWALVVCGWAPWLSVSVERSWVWVRGFSTRSSYVHAGPHMPFEVLQMGNLVSKW